MKYKRQKTGTKLNSNNRMVESNNRVASQYNQMAIPNNRVASQYNRIAIANNRVVPQDDRGKLIECI